VILAKDDGRTLERWTFDITSKATSPSLVAPAASTKPINTPKQDPQSSAGIAVPNVLKQIVAATTSLPDLPSPGVFTLQAYVNADAAKGVPGEGLEESHRVEGVPGLMGDWRDVTDEGQVPFTEGVETQQVSWSGKILR
jgi:hypothetical protein